MGCNLGVNYVKMIEEETTPTQGKQKGCIVISKETLNSVGINHLPIPVRSLYPGAYQILITSKYTMPGKLLVTRYS